MLRPRTKMPFRAPISTNSSASSLDKENNLKRQRQAIKDITLLISCINYNFDNIGEMQTVTLETTSSMDTFWQHHIISKYKYYIYAVWRNRHHKSKTYKQRSELYFNANTKTLVYLVKPPQVLSKSTKATPIRPSTFRIKLGFYHHKANTEKNKNSVMKILNVSLSSKQDKELNLTLDVVIFSTSKA